MLLLHLDILLLSEMSCLRGRSIADDAAFLGEPETGGCAERWIRTLKEQCLWAELHDTIEELRQAVARFVDTYNTQWLMGRLGHRTPKEAYQDAITTAAA